MFNGPEQTDLLILTNKFPPKTAEPIAGQRPCGDFVISAALCHMVKSSSDCTRNEGLFPRPRVLPVRRPPEAFCKIPLRNDDQLQRTPLLRQNRTDPDQVVTSIAV